MGSLTLKKLRFKMHPLAIVCLVGCILLWLSSPVRSEVMKPHPLPPSLAAWSDRSGDYFDQVQKTSPGYLVWSKFPITVSIQPADQNPRSQVWFKAVTQAVQEWNQYLPLKQVERDADIQIDRTAPPIKFPPTARVRAAETRFEFYSDAGILRHRMRVAIAPNQADLSLLGTARHELGHALGIWGHSPLETDALYFSQVRNPSPMSARDINTLKRVYEQPTQLGWKK
jgi:predicted Zn-dependent protease